MEILSWNIQAGLGVDGIVDFARIASVISKMGNPDVVCLQEVGQYVPGIGGGGDNVAALLEHFANWTPVFGAAFDRIPVPPNAAIPRARFGNLILSRLPVIQNWAHPLPQPADPSTKHMPRQATEVVVQGEGEGKTVRILTTHLEFHSESQRDAQARRILALHEEVCDAAEQPALAPEGGPYAAVPRPTSTVLCGDFNFETSSSAYRELTAKRDDSNRVFIDAWVGIHPDVPHAPTCGIHDHVQWPQGPHCRDFFFCTNDLAARVEDVRVDTATAASDHQPVLLKLG